MGINIDGMLALLREHRVSGASFHPDGSLASVAFEPTMSELPAALAGGKEETGDIARDPYVLAALELAGKRGEDERES